MIELIVVYISQFKWAIFPFEYISEEKNMKNSLK